MGRGKYLSWQNIKEDLYSGLMNTIIYCRKSSEEDNRQILSIESQVDEMAKLAARDGLTITKIFKESMTAKAPGRPVFAEMMAFVEQNRNCTILVWKLDRLARNPVDEGRIKWLLQQGVIAEIKTPDRSYFPSDNALIASVEFGMANQYIRDLRQNVMRGNRAKLERGGWPNMAPFGYLNDKANRSVIVNPSTAPAVKRIFALYATGIYHLKEITKVIYEQGYRGKNEKKLSKSNIHKILQNRFYYGVMVKGDQYYEGNHEPLITKALFDDVQAVLSGKHYSKRQTHFFPLRGVMICAVCGCMLTATLQKGKHIYYYCTNGKGICDQRKKHLTQANAIALIASVLQELKTDEGKLDLAIRASKAKHQGESRSVDAIRQKLQLRLSAVREQQDALARRKDTPEDVYDRNMASLKNEQLDIEMELSKIDANKEQGKITFEQVKDAFIHANREADAFLFASPVKQRAFVETVLSNVFVKDQKAQHFQFKPAYQVIANIPKNATIEQLCAGEDSNLHAFRRYHLKVVRLPFRHPRNFSILIQVLRYDKVLVRGNNLTP